MRRLRSALAWLSWYVRELSGETAYDHYLAHHRRRHPDTTPLTRRQFDDARTRPAVRCC